MNNPVIECFLCKKPNLKNKMIGVNKVDKNKNIIDFEMKFVDRECLEKCKYVGNIFDNNPL